MPGEGAMRGEGVIPGDGAMVTPGLGVGTPGEGAGDGPGLGAGDGVPGPGDGPGLGVCAGPDPGGGAAWPYPMSSTMSATAESRVACLTRVITASPRTRSARRRIMGGFTPIQAYETSGVTLTEFGAALFESVRSICRVRVRLVFLAQTPSSPAPTRERSAPDQPPLPSF